MKPIDIIQKRIKELERSQPDLSKIDNVRRRHPATKQWLGRLMEAKYILKLLKNSK